MSVFSRALGFVRSKLERLSDGPADRARREEALGDLEAATASYIEAGAEEDAVRLFVLRAETTTEPRSRLRLLTQAALLAERVQGDDAGERARALRVRRARLALDLARSGLLRLTPSELGEVGRSLEACGEPDAAAEAYALAGDLEAQTRSLVSAGAIERLEQVLDEQQSRARLERRREQLAQSVNDLLVAGRRHAALALCREGPVDDERLRQVARGIEARRVCGSTAKLTIDGELQEVAFGDSVTIGRRDATITVASPSVSRVHLSIRRAPGGVEALDLGSSNGTTLGGARLEVPVKVGDGIELLLGGEVTLAIAPRVDSGVSLDLAGRKIHAPLGPLRVGGWTVEPGDDEWLEVVDVERTGLVLGDLWVDERVELCRGDELRERVAGPVRIAVPT